MEQKKARSAGARSPALRVLSGVLIIGLTIALIALCVLRARADRSLTVTIPSCPVTLNAQPWDSADAVYPLLVCGDVTYLPAPAAEALGLQVEQTPNGGLSVSLTGENTQPPAPKKQDAPNPKWSSAAVLDCPITIEGERYAGDAPFLKYRGVVYLPVTEALCRESFCLDFEQSETAGLSLRGTGRLRPPTDALPHFILHAGGVTADGMISTNSIEAANRSYSEGYRCLEMDFNWTKDDALVCLHDWGMWKKQQNDSSLHTPVTLEEFERLSNANPDFHSFTPALLNDWLQAHPDARIVTDVKEDNVAAMLWRAENYPNLRRQLIVQIYSLAEYGPIRALGYENIILTMYRIPWEEYHDLETLSAFIRDTQVLAITMAADENVRDVFEALVATGIPVYVHTLDEPEEQAQWMADGAYGIYTNYGDTRTD